MPSKTTTTTRLSAWDQVAMRSHTRLICCFPFDDKSHAAAIKHLKKSLADVAAERPDFAGRLTVDADGSVYHTTNPETDFIPLVVDDSADDGDAVVRRSFADLTTNHFSPADFVGARFKLDCNLETDKPGEPVVTVRVLFSPGGIYLAIYFNHAFGDGKCFATFLDVFSAHTRGQKCGHASSSGKEVSSMKSLDFMQTKAHQNWDDLAKRIVEYNILDSPTGPTAPRMQAGGVSLDEIEKIGNIFVFKNTMLDKLRSKLGGNGSTLIHSKYVALAALTWAHIARARRDDKHRYEGQCDNKDEALIQTMVNWTARAFLKDNKDYFGNATVVAPTLVPTEMLLHAADGCSATTLAGIKPLADAIKQTIEGVDEDFVRERTELFASVPDPRSVGLRFDPRTPQDLGFNTWRFFGADTQWLIPGVDGSSDGKSIRPAAVRRMQDAWNMSGALILPAKRESEEHELLVTLPKTSMDILLQDSTWMEWVDQVIP